MLMMKRKPNKWMKALWTEVFPEQVKQSQGKRRRRRTKRERELRTYGKRRKWFLVEHPWCEWGLRQVPPQHIRSEQIHHARGRLYGLLLDERYWFAVSAKAHDWIHRNPNAARALGLLCEHGKWGTAE